MTAQHQIADFAAARFNMVESQIRPNKVRGTKLLDAMGELPRELFVPQPLAGIAYMDKDVQVINGRFLMEPMVLARLLEEANLKGTERALDVAPATGYSTALLAKLVKSVIGVESDEALAAQASSNLQRLELLNASIKQGPLTEGWKANAPYDLILVNGCAGIVPEALTAQLAEGGKLMITIREFGPAHFAHKGEARLYEKIRGQISHRALFDANVAMLPGFEAKAGFTF